MNKTELNDSLNFIVTDNASIEIAVYAILKEDSAPMKLDIKSNDLPDISKMFVKSIKDNIISKDDFSILPLSTADERGKCFYQYDLELPEELKLLESVITNDNLSTFDFRTRKLTDIDSLIIVMAVDDNEISLYKKLSSIEVIGRGGYILGKANHRLERFKEQLLRISSKFQLIRVNEEIVILDLSAIERSFGFHDVIKREAAKGISAIDSMKIVSDIESLKEMINDVTFARKLTKVAKGSPVIKLSISNSEIINFSKKHPATVNMKYTDDNKQFNLTSKKLKDLFVKLLNDDLLTSELTKLHYASLAKDGYETEVENKETE